MSRRWCDIFTQITWPHSTHLASLMLRHLASNGFTSSQCTRRCVPRVGSRELGVGARAKPGGGGDMAKINSYPTGGMVQSGTSTQIDSLLEPATTIVPKTGISAWRRRFVEIGSVLVDMVERSQGDVFTPCVSGECHKYISFQNIMS